MDGYKPQQQAHVAAFNHYCYAAQVQDHVYMWEDWTDAKETAAREGTDFVWHTDHMEIVRPWANTPSPVGA